ncbi:MAG: TolC family protein [Muribaculaceae bacterium]|nr:TolC family protein [Muribaculaceae bacterium]
MKFNKIILAAATLAASMAFTGCNMYGKFKMPEESALGQEYVKAVEAETDSTTFGNLKWQEVFTDPVLVDLIYQALDNNKDLRNAKLNVDIAHAQLLGAKLSYLPSLALTPNAGKAMYDKTWSEWSYQIPLAASWEIDIFGKILNSKRGAAAAYEMSKDYHQAVRSQIIGAVANTYYALVALENSLTLSRNTAELWKQSVQTMKDFKEAGRVNEAAVVQSSAQYYSILASITDLEVQLDQMNNTMSLLMNVMPQKWMVSPDAQLTAPQIMRNAIPMRELAARPDVRAAEQSLAAAYYTTAAARSAFYPGLSITANGGFTNSIGTLITNPGVWFVQLAGSLTAPLFSRGANISRLKAAKAQQQQAMNNFEYALMSASAEVSDAMTTYEKSLEKTGYLIEQVDNLSKAVEYTEELLRVGSAGTTYLEVLTAQQNLLQSQLAAISNDRARASAVISLYQSLGGGR